MIEQSGDLVRMRFQPPRAFCVVAWAFTVLGVLITLVVAFDRVHGDRVEFQGVASGIVTLLFGVCFLWTQSNVDLVLDRAARTLVYKARPQVGGVRRERASFDDAARVTLSGTINWVTVALLLNDGRRLFLKTVPRTARGQREVRSVTESLRDALNVEVVVPDYIRTWWKEL